jgi:hypothetical protein
MSMMCVCVYGESGEQMNDVGDVRLVLAQEAARRSAELARLQEHERSMVCCHILVSQFVKCTP